MLKLCMVLSVATGFAFSAQPPSAAGTISASPPAAATSLDRGPNGRLDSLHQQWVDRFMTKFLETDEPLSDGK